ncbi:ABC transporter permease [Acrocarpospora sp. B8E8]|uniref:ABC transporter permease n=1 Tax=Acrocarpospora sp. B8E8 TaxID=3153572 RepID=UPI00325DF534
MKTFTKEAVSAGETAAAGPETPRRGRRRTPGRFKDAPQRLISIAAPIGLLLLWELVSRVGLLDTRFFPPPSQIARQFMEMAGSGELVQHTWVSIRRLALGFLVGGVPAVVLGLVMGLYRWPRLIIEPLIAATYPIPKSAIFPLFLIIFGLGEASKIAVVAVGVFFPMVINTAAGVLEIQPIYHDVGRNFEAGRLQTFRTIALPGAMPLILTGVKLAVGMALMLIVVAEMLGGSDGLGFLIWNAWATFRVETMYVALIVISALGVILSLALNEMERFLAPWRVRR